MYINFNSEEKKFVKIPHGKAWGGGIGPVKTKPFFGLPFKFQKGLVGKLIVPPQQCSGFEPGPHCLGVTRDFAQFFL